MKTVKSSRSARRAALRLSLWTAAVLGLPLFVAATNVAIKVPAVLTEPPAPPALALPAAPARDASRPVAVVLLGNGPTESTDFLAPYEVLATSGAYDVFALAPERRPVPLFPGELDVLPHMSLAEYDERIGERPRVIVLPNMDSGGPAPDARIISWIRRQWRDGTTLLTICAGSYVAAQGGLLDGRRATSHASVLRVAGDELPEVTWLGGLRWVDDGDLISSGGVTSGVDATLYFLSRELGPAEAKRVALELGYPHTRFLDDPTYTVPPASAAPTYLQALFSGFDDVGLALYDGASEIALGALTDTYPRSYAARLRPLAPERGFVRTRNGLHLVPRWGLGDAPELDRLIVAGEPTPAEAEELNRWAAERELEPEALADGRYAYDAVVLEVAARHSAAVALDVARSIEYPTAHLKLAAPSLPFALLVPPLALALAGLTLAIALRGVWRAR